MSNEKLFKLVKGLAARTLEGKTVWQPTIEDHIYQTSVADYTIQIGTRYNSRVNAEDYIISILNKLGNVVEEVSDETLNETKDSSSSENYYSVLKLMYESARRQALGVDDALDAILEEFEDPIPF